MKFAVLCSDIEIHGRIEFVFAVFILYESLYHGWRSGWFVFLINYVDQLQYTDECATVSVVIALWTNVAPEFVPLNTKGRQSETEWTLVQTFA